jgi:tetratricopeptide (TPR) repeat protein
MSRSIHTTRKSLEERRKVQDENKEERRAEMAYLKAELRKKRLIKALIQEERHTNHPDIFVRAEGIPISIKDTGEHLHYPASIEDLLAVMRLLPPGQLNGLSGITLCLGAHAQGDEDGAPDPLVGRPGLSILPGVFSARTIGMYYADTAMVELFAYVYQGDLKHRALKESYLKLIMLSTFMHELAHHDDFSQRLARGKWRGDHEKKKEIYAEEREHQWAEQYVLPYVLSTYPNEVQALLSWLEEHGGVSLPLAMLLSDPRVTRTDGLVRVDSYNVRGSIEFLMEDVEADKTRTETRIFFARNLHYEGHYELARQSLAKVLQEAPNDLEALTLVADIDVHEERYQPAEKLCQQVLAIDPEWLEAWEVLSDVYVAQTQWSQLLHSTTSALALKPSGYGYLRALRLKARALLQLARYEEVSEIIRELPTLNGKLGPSTTWELSAKMLLQQARYQEALDLAREALPKCMMPARTILEAVRFDAAYQLGRPQEADVLSAFTMRHLRALGFSAWADTLVSYTET